MCFFKKVKVMVCTASGQLPNPYCPVKETREYRKGKEPTAVCSVHSPLPVEYVDVRICIKDLPEEHVANEYCIRIETRQYVKGTEPTVSCLCVPVCDIPCDETGILMIWSGFMIAGLSMKDTAIWKEADLPAYLNALVIDGIPAHRDCFCFLDSKPGDEWQSYILWVGDTYDVPNEEYYAVIDRRLQMFYDRKLTEVISLTPYGLSQNVVFDPKFQSCLRTFIRRTKKFLPYVRFETFNEPNTNEDAKVEVNKTVVEILQSEGIPNKYIQIAFADRSANSAILINTLKSEGTMSLHWVGSMETIQTGDTPWEGSPGTQWLQGAGLGSSDDGQDVKRKALGLNWGYLEAQGITEAQRPNDEQEFNIVKWMLRKFEKLLAPTDGSDNYIHTGIMVHGRLVEHLSAAGFQHPLGQPNLLQAIEIGRSERLKMREAYNIAMETGGFR